MASPQVSSPYAKGLKNDGTVAHGEQATAGRQRRHDLQGLLANALFGMAAWVALAAFVEETLCGPGAALRSDLAVLQDAAPTRASCGAWLLRHPAAALTLSNTAWGSELFVAVGTATSMLIILALGELHTKPWRILVMLVIRLGYRVTAMAELLAWINNDKMGVAPSIILHVKSGSLVASSVFEAAMSRFCFDVSGTIQVALDSVEMACNLAIVLLLFTHDDVEQPGRATAFAAAVAACATVPVLVPTLSLLLHAVRGRRSRAVVDQGGFARAPRPGKQHEVVPARIRASNEAGPSGGQPSAGRPSQEALLRPLPMKELHSLPESNKSAAARAVIAGLMDPEQVLEYTSIYPQTVRVSIKVKGCEPEELRPDWQQHLRTVLETQGRVRSFAVRRGCTHLVVDMDEVDADTLLDGLQQDAAKTRSTTSHVRHPSDEGLMQLLMSPRGVERVVSPLFQNSNSCPQLSVTVHAIKPATLLPKASSAVQLPSVLDVFPAVTELPTRAAATVHTTLTLSEPLSPGSACVARHCTTGFLPVHVVEVSRGGTEVTVGFPVPVQPGRVQFEVLDVQSGRLGMAAAHLLLPSGAAAAELLRVSEAKPANSAAAVPVVLHPVLRDVGACVDTMLLDARDGLDKTRRHEAERLVSALLKFCSLMGLKATHDMLTALSERAYGSAPGHPLSNNAGAAQPETSPTTADMRHPRRVMDDGENMASSSSLPLLLDGVGRAAAPSLPNASYLHPSRSVLLVFQHGQFIACLLAGVFTWDELPLHLSFNIFEQLLLVTAAVRHVATPSLALVLDASEERFRPYFGVLCILSRTLFCFAIAYNLVDVCDEKPPSVSVVVTMLIGDFLCVYVRNPSQRMAGMYPAIAVYGLSQYMMCRTCKQENPAMVAATVVLAASAVNFAHSRWLSRQKASFKASKAKKTA